MTIRKLKALLWILCLVAFVGAGYTFYGIWQGKQEDRYTARAQAYFNDLIKSRTGEVEPTRSTEIYPETRYASLWKVNIIGKEEPKVDPTAKPAGSEGPRAPVVLPIDQVLSVGSIMWSDDPLRRLLKLVYKDTASGPGQGSATKSRLLWVSEGQALKPPYDEAPYFGKLVSIDKQTATFQWADSEQVVNPGLGHDGTEQPQALFALRSEDDPLAGVDAIPEESLQIEPGVWVMGTNDRAAIEADPAKLLKEDLQFRTVPPSSDGERSSLELKTVKADSIPGRYGFESGDRIVSVNGFPVPSEASAINYYKQNPDVPAYHVIYMRRGAERSITIYNRKK